MVFSKSRTTHPKNTIYVSSKERIQSTMTKVFFSYRRLKGQKEFVQDLVERCDREGLETWLDTRDIPTFSRWEDEIFLAIQDSDYVILCMSPQYFESENCLVECYTAQGYMKNVLPVILPDVEEQDKSQVYELCKKFEETKTIYDLNILDFHSGFLGLEEDRESQIQRLIQAMKTPTPADNDYVGFVYYRRNHVKLATEIADALTAAGVPSFIHTRNIDIGLNWRPVAWNAALKAKFHIVILSPDIAESRYIQKEILLSRSRKIPILPVLPEEILNKGKEAMEEMRNKMSGDTNFEYVNAYQWVIAENGRDQMMEDLIRDCKQFVKQKKCKRLEDSDESSTRSSCRSSCTFIPYTK